MPAPSPARWRSSPLAVQCLVYVAFAAPLGMYGAAWPDARHLFGQTAGALGTLATAYGLGRMATSASALVVLARVSPRRATVLLCVGLAAVDAAVAVTRSFPVLLAALAGVGLVSGALDSLGARYQTVVRDLRRAGLMFGAYGVGATLGPAVVALTSWTTGFLVAAGLALLAAAAAARPGVAWPAEMGEGSAPRPVGRGPLPVGAVLLSLALAGTLVGLEAMSGNWLATYFEDHRGTSARAAGLAVSAFWAGVTVGRLALGRLRVGAARLLRTSPVALALAVVLVPVLPRPVALAWVAVVGVLLSVIFPTALSTTVDRVGRAGAGRVSGWQLLAANGSAITLLALVGVGVERWGGGVPLIVVIALAVMAVPLCWRAAAHVDRPTEGGTRAGTAPTGPGTRPA